MNTKSDYTAFLHRKIRIANLDGFEVNDADINPALKPHNRIMVKWLVRGGRRACFAAFGLHKTVTQLEAVRLILEKAGGGKALIICPLGVMQEFKRDAVRILGWSEPPRFIRSFSETNQTSIPVPNKGEDTGTPVNPAQSIYLTNYETIRDGKLDPRLFTACSLDEASILRGFGGSKTFREFMRLFTGDAGPLGDRRGTDRVQYRFVATATPSPNEYIELLAYADFLGIMDVSQAKTRFFKRDSTRADHLTIHPHKEEEFWLWVASWALFVQQPSDITGNPSDDEGYNLPPLDIRWHEIKSDHRNAGTEKNGQGRLFSNSAIGVQDSAREKRNSLQARIDKMLELRAEDPAAHRILWHDLEAERQAIEHAIPSVVSVYGNQPLDDREQNILDFSDGKYQELAAKPVITGSGCNFQRHCSWAIYLGIGFKFNDFIQSVHRIHRFLQAHQVRIDLIYTEAERDIRKQLERKWSQHNEMVKKMTDIIKQYGLNHAEMAATLSRKMGVERMEISGRNFLLVNNDAVQETKTMNDNTVGLILTSIPFSTQYEYSPNYADFGHTANNDEFFQQMDFLTPQLLRVLMPGRIAAIHVKDRIVPGGMTGLGFQTVYPFHKHCIDHFTKHGFAYIGMKTIVTDVVRENKQTYRLGWTEQCKDGSKMGVGMPEYLLLFRKPPSDTTNSYADTPVVKSKTDYSKARWQVDAHGFARSNGNRLLMPEELKELSHSDIFQLFKEHNLNNIYDFEEHVKIGETLNLHGRLPSSFMLLQPQSWSDEVWSDITRMLTLNSRQQAKGREQHLCPMQFDIADRVITQMSNPGDIVLDPFSGIGTVPYRSILKGRIGWGIELATKYWLDAAYYCKQAESQLQQNIPTLFSLEKEVANG